MATAPSEHSARTLAGVLDGALRLGEEGFVSVPVERRSLSEAERASPLVGAVGEIFSLRGFATARAPLDLGPAPLPDLATEGLAELRVSSLPLKFPGSDYRLPRELKALLPIVLKAASFEQALGCAEEEYCYLTVQCTVVSAGETQRGSAIHSDGVQGPRIRPKAPVERGYLVVDRVPPRFFVQPFAMAGVDVDRHLLDAVFAAQARAESAVQLPAGHLVLFDSYCVHQALPAAAPGPRSFLRLAYSTRQYDRLGNSVNAAFAAEYEQEGWRFEPRPLPDLPQPPGYASG